MDKITAYLLNTSLRSWRYCVLVEWDLAAGPPLAAKAREINTSSPLHFLDRGSAAKSLITQYRQLRRLLNTSSQYIESACNAVRDLKPATTTKCSMFRLAEQELCTFSTLFCTFVCRRCAATTWNYLISRFVEDGNTRQEFYFFSWTFSWRIERDGISAIKVNAAQIHFFSDVFVA